MTQLRKRLREWHVRPGDVVEWHGDTYTAFSGYRPPRSQDCWARSDAGDWISSEAFCTLVSRAPCEQASS